jgi:hypothetical protein
MVLVDISLYINTRHSVEPRHLYCTFLPLVHSPQETSAYTCESLPHSACGLRHQAPPPRALCASPTVLSSVLHADGGLRTSHGQTYIALEAMGMRPIPKTPPPQDGADEDGTVAVGFPYQGGWQAIDPAQMPSPQMGLGDSMRFTASQCAPSTAYHVLSGCLGGPL